MLGTGLPIVAPPVKPVWASEPLHLLCVALALWSIDMPIAPDKLTQFRHLRRHGANLETAARKADLTLDEAHKAEGRFYCPNCPAETGPFGGAYVPRSECPHWDYETL